MNALASDASNLDYFAPAPVIIAASSDEAMASATRAVEAAGRRIAAAVPIYEASERLAQQAKMEAIWIELDKDGGDAADQLLTRVAHDSDEGRYSAILATSSTLIDRLPACVLDSAIELVADADDGDRVAAFATATASARRPLMLSDVRSDRNAERLRQLSDEVNRIASTLAKLSTSIPVAPTPKATIGNDAEGPPVAVETVRAAIRARRLRSNYFPDDLFADPAWDMLLDLLQAELSHLRVPVSSLCIAAAVPATTALRWLKSCVKQGLFIRRADPHDGRRVFVELAPETSRALRLYFAEVGKVVPI